MMITENSFSPYIKKIARLTPYTLIAATLLSIAALLIVTFGIFDLIRSINTPQESPIISTVMFMVFSFLLALTAFFSINAWVKLRNVSRNHNEQLFNEAIDAVVYFLRAFLGWVILLAIVLICTLFVPAY